MNPVYVNSLFLIKESPHSLRNRLLIQPKYYGVTHCFNSIRYQGSKMWNCFPKSMKYINSVSDLTNGIQKWNGPECHWDFCLHYTLLRICHCNTVIKFCRNAFFFIYHIGKKLSTLFIYFKTDAKYSL